MKPTKKQLDRRNKPFHFRYRGMESWFYLCADGCSFHQVWGSGQNDVHRLPVEDLIKALVACGYIELQKKGK